MAIEHRVELWSQGSNPCILPLNDSTITWRSTTYKYIPSRTTLSWEFTANMAAKAGIEPAYP